MSTESSSARKSTQYSVSYSVDVAAQDICKELKDLEEEDF